MRARQSSPTDGGRGSGDEEEVASVIARGFEEARFSALRARPRATSLHAATVSPLAHQAQGER